MLNAVEGILVISINNYR